MSGSPASRRPKGPGVRAGITLGSRRKLPIPSGAVEREFAIAKAPTMLKFYSAFLCHLSRNLKLGCFLRSIDQFILSIAGTFAITISDTETQRTFVPTKLSSFSFDL